MMAVTDRQVEAVRALLEKDFDRHAQLADELGDEGSGGYFALVAAGFLEAVERKFGDRTSVKDIVDYIADVRSRSEEARKDIDPNLAERMVRAVYDDSSLADIDGHTIRSIQGWLLGAIIYDAELDSAGLDEFMAEIRKVADHWTR